MAQQAGFQTCRVIITINQNYYKILESDWSSTALIRALTGQLHTSCTCNWTVVRVMPE